jgi:hypothetical protein
MNQDFINITIILVIIFGVMYFYFNYQQLNTMSLREGIENRNNSSNINTDELKERVDNMEIELEKLKSSLNISNNRAEYESMIIYLDDIIAYTMLKDVSQMKLDQSVNKLAGNLSDLNKLQESRKTLNELITWLDKN